MPIREIAGYSNHANGGGCFFLKSHQLQIHDAKTGILRRERVFTTDEYVTEHDFETVIECSERFGIEVADALGWISPEVHLVLTAKIAELTARSNDAVQRMDEAETAGIINMRQASGAIARVEASEARTADLELAAKDYASKMSALERKVAAAERKAKAATVKLAKLQA
tara:strand:- start:158 stop:664 length:507 start_codon:yes stop_codon:yes gene_type:complete